MALQNWIPLFLVSALLFVLAVQDASAGCTQSRLCCTGKNITCRAKGPRMNSPTSRVCFCDEYCANLGDCCRDYKQQCQAQDCALGQWDQWSRCDTSCGWGKKSRTRPIRREPRFGGKACNETTETSTCYGNYCRKTRHLKSNRLELRDNKIRSSEISETAKIIPAMYGTWRKDKLYDPFSDIRKNLFYHYRSNMIVKRPSYCAHFEITRSAHKCHKQSKDNWATLMRSGTHVCLECQPSAMKSALGNRCNGHGVFMEETRWSALTVPGCHGRWRMRTYHGECTCDSGHDQSFIFV